MDIANDFLKVQQPKNLDELKSELKEIAEKVKSLQEGKNRDWSDTDKFKEAVLLLGDYPPVKLIEDLVKYYNKKKTNLLNHDLLDLMDNVGMEELKLDDDTKLAVKESISVTNPKDNPAWFEWLRSNGLGSMIKLNFEFDKQDLPQEFYDYLDQLKQQGIEHKPRGGINTNSLKAQIKDRREKGLEMPPEHLCKVNIHRYVDVK